MSWRQLRKHHILWITNIILRSNPDDFKDEEERKMFMEVVETLNKKKEKMVRNV